MKPGQIIIYEGNKTRPLYTIIAGFASTTININILFGCGIPAYSKWTL